jgi:hypothetical protein
MTALLISVAVQINTNTLSELMRVALKKLYLYPIVFLFCWIPSLITDIYVTAIDVDDTSDISPVLRGFGNVCPVLQGFLVAVVFFSHNRIVRDHWFHALKLYELRRYCSSTNLLAATGARGSGNANEGSGNNYDDDNHKIQVMMRAENESDYIDDETRAAFAFRVSFSSGGSGHPGNDFRPSDMTSTTTTSTMNPISCSRDSTMGSAFVLSSSVNSEPMYVGRQTNQGLLSPEPARGTLSSQPKLSFLHQNLLFNNSRLTASGSSPRIIASNSNQMMSSSPPQHLAASLSSSPPGDDPDALRANTRSIQMSSVSTNSSSTAVSKLRKDHLKYNLGDNEGLDIADTVVEQKEESKEHHDDVDNDEDEDCIQVEYTNTRDTNDFGVKDMDIV